MVYGRQGKQLRCQNHLQRSALVWCTGGVPEPGKPQGEQSCQESAARVTAADKTRTRPGATAPKRAWRAGLRGRVL